MVILVDFGSPTPPLKSLRCGAFIGLEIALLFECRFCRLQVSLGGHLGLILDSQDAIWGSFLALLAQVELPKQPPRG